MMDLLAFIWGLAIEMELGVTVTAQVSAGLAPDQMLFGRKMQVNEVAETVPLFSALSCAGLKVQYHRSARESTVRPAALSSLHLWMQNCFARNQASC